MQLIQEDNKLYILVSNAEQMEGRSWEDWNGWDDVHSTDKYHEMTFYHKHHMQTFSSILNTREGDCLQFQGNKGFADVRVDKVHKVNRVVPYDTTTRSYWGEFRRKHPLVPRLNKLVRAEYNYIIETTLLYQDQEVNSTEFNAFGVQQHMIDPHSYRRWTRDNIKTWNLTKDRNLGPNLKDYSLNDCYKYYATL